MLWRTPFLALALAITMSSAFAGATPEERFFAGIAAAPQGRTQLAGGQGGKEFQELFPDGGILVGFDVWQGPYGGSKKVVLAICPIYETATGRHRGQVHGTKAGSPVTFEAKKGDAVAAMNIRTGSIVDGFRLVFQKIDYFGFKLTAASSYKSEAIGGDGGEKRDFPLTGNGRPIVGLFGGDGLAVDRLALVFADKK